MVVEQGPKLDWNDEIFPLTDHSNINSWPIDFFNEQKKHSYVFWTLAASVCVIGKTDDIATTFASRE